MQSTKLNTGQSDKIDIEIDLRNTQICLIRGGLRIDSPR
jgi:hypothetical protein